MNVVQEIDLGKIDREVLMTIWNEPFPCRGCVRADICEQSEIECKAFRMYATNGSWKERDVGKLLRRMEI